MRYSLLRAAILLSSAGPRLIGVLVARPVVFIDKTKSVVCCLFLLRYSAYVTIRQVRSTHSPSVYVFTRSRTCVALHYVLPSSS